MGKSKAGHSVFSQASALLVLKRFDIGTTHLSKARGN